MPDSIFGSAQRITQLLHLFFIEGAQRDYTSHPAQRPSQPLPTFFFSFLCSRRQLQTLPSCALSGRLEEVGKGSNVSQTKPTNSLFFPPDSHHNCEAVRKVTVFRDCCTWNTQTISFSPMYNLKAEASHWLVLNLIQRKPHPCPPPVHRRSPPLFPGTVRVG